VSLFVLVGGWPGSDGPVDVPALARRIRAL
jgi:hypothetical protein